MTTAISTPVRTTSAIWRATVCTTTGSTPTPPPPNISPPSLSRTRRWPERESGPASDTVWGLATLSSRGLTDGPPRGAGARGLNPAPAPRRTSGLADLEAREGADVDARLLQHRADRLL